ncbi:hypothetical protein C7271_16160 [filamentous cyanobacterium CCP5]|nr:hypothetical protein C7271_16160 [filamentous cyanobacterium CCP5]
MHPDDHQRVVTHLQTAVEQKSAYTTEYRVVHTDDSVRWLAVRGQVLLGPEEQVERIIGVCFDVTERKQAEEGLRQSQRLNQEILEAIPDLLLWMQPDGTCVGLSEGMHLANLFPDPKHPYGVNQYDLPNLSPRDLSDASQKW